MRLHVYQHKEGTTLSKHIHCHEAAYLTPRVREQHYHSTYTLMRLPVDHHV
ncbi:hypothetical protein DPMN_173180 [Dreissena polymorpha]|uniref:Uncharacterized protein n=1 Tax=Dreissena polymorpha TaxID=45954 RepID=A0A9D4E3Q9_DREPO|nr:hypothetical protein DPMN_173180 [Dreissena polymorpha]